MVIHVQYSLEKNKSNITSVFLFSKVFRVFSCVNPNSFGSSENSDGKYFLTELKYKECTWLDEG